ncbi:MAG: aminoacyl-tRNA hydrolase [Bacteroidia bacterium]
MKFLIAGLGNIGDEYALTRHNIGFDITYALAKKHDSKFEPARHADYAHFSLKGKSLHLIKPTTYMNLSGKAVRYWMEKLKLTPENVLVIVDDLAIPFGKIRIREKGSDAGHNGLKSINELLETQNYPRLRFGIGSEFSKGRQIDFVLSRWNEEEQKQIPELVKRSVEAVECFAQRGITTAMNLYNK